MVSADGFRVHASVGRVLYRLPHRRAALGSEQRGSAAGCFVLAAAVGLSLTIGYLAILISAFSARALPGFILVAAFTSPLGIFGAAALLLVVWVILGGRSELLLTRDRLLLRERIGPVVFRRTVAPAAIVHFRIHAFGNGLGALDMDMAEGPKRRWAIDYPMSLLEELAADLSRRKDEILNGPSPGPAEVELLPDGVRVTVRPMGWGAWLGPLVALVATLMTLMFVGLLMAVDEHARPHLPAALVVVGGFWLVGMVAALAVFRSSRRRFLLEYSDRSLKVDEADPLGRRRREWKKSDVWGFEVAGNRLDVRLAGGLRHTIVRGKDTPTLEWIAGVLRRARPKKDLEVVAVDAPKGTCQVCATSMEERIVWCRRCRTPHHRECWVYTGMCSTFGCREIGYVEA